MMFRLQRNNETIIISLYVDDGMCATNSDKLYKQFIKDLKASTSYQIKASWT